MSIFNGAFFVPKRLMTCFGGVIVRGRIRRVESDCGFLRGEETDVKTLMREIFCISISEREDIITGVVK